MWPSGRRRRVALLLLVSFFLGCAFPSSASPPLTAAAAHNLMDSWNPHYCKVVEFYGFYTPGERANTRLAYVLLANPGDKNQKQSVYEARFQLLTLPDGSPRWFLVSLISHGSGLTRRQGWDSLMVPVKEAVAPSR
jgi:hypothetical protein